MATQEDMAHLNNIVNAINEIDGYVGGMDYNQCARDEETQGVAARNLQMIGDAAGMLTDEVKDEYGYVDFNVLIGLKNANYDKELELDHHFLWNIIENDLPFIRDDIARVSEEIDREEDLT